MVRGFEVGCHQGGSKQWLVRSQQCLHGKGGGRERWRGGAGLRDGGRVPTEGRVELPVECGLLGEAEEAWRPPKRE